MKINTIFFDFDNTLFDHSSSCLHGLEILKSKSVTLSNFSVETLFNYYDEALNEVFNKYIDKKFLNQNIEIEKFNNLFIKLKIPIPPSEIIEHYASIYRKAYFNGRIATNGSIELLKLLKKAGYLVGILTNGKKDIQNEFARYIGVYELVDGIYTSEEIGISKPDSKFFKYALSKFNTKPTESVMIGDNVETDIKGAINFQMNAILYSPTTKQEQLKINGHFVPVIRKISDALIKIKEIEAK